MTTMSAAKQDEGSPRSGEKVILRKQVSLIDCIALTAGTIVGSGIFISPKGVLQNSGESVGWSLVVWVVTGVLSIMGALCYAELGTIIPKSGGDFTFLNEGFTPLLGFLRLWTSIVAVRTGAWTVLSITAAKYVLSPFFYGCHPPLIVERLLAACILSLVFYLNCASVAWSRRVQVIFSVSKYVAVFIIIISGLIFLGKGNTENFHNSFVQAEGTSFARIPLAFYSALFAYAGWQYLPQVTEEIVNINRNLPLGMTISMLIVSSVYTLTNIAYFAVLTPQEILSSNAVAVDFARRILGAFWWVLPIGVSVSCVGSINGGLFQSSRMLFVASRDGHLPKIAAMINVTRLSPLPAAALMLPICLLMLTSNDVYELLNFLSFSRWAFIALTVTIIPYHRWKYPDAHRPFKVPLIVPILFSMCALFVVVMSLYSAPFDCGVGLAISLAGIPVYLLGVRWQTKPEWLVRGSHKSTVLLQKLFYVVLQEEQTC